MSEGELGEALARIPAEKAWLGIREVIHALGGVSESTVYRMLRRGELISKRTGAGGLRGGRKSRFTRESVEKAVRGRFGGINAAQGGNGGEDHGRGLAE